MGPFPFRGYASRMIVTLHLTPAEVQIIEQLLGTAHVQGQAAILAAASLITKVATSKREAASAVDNITARIVAELDVAAVDETPSTP